MRAEALVMQHGSIVESSDGIQLFRSPQHFYTQRLLASILPVRPPRRLPKRWGPQKPLRRRLGGTQAMSANRNFNCSEIEMPFLGKGRR